MSSPLRALHWFIPLPSLILAAGCGTSPIPEPEPATAAAPVGAYEPLLDGSTDLLFVHVDQLAQQFRQTTEPSPTQARAALLDYTDAVLQTTDRLIFRDGLTPGQRLRAAEAAFMALQLRMETDKSASPVEAIVELADRILAKFPKSQVATLASFAKANTLFTAPESLLPDRKARYNRVVDAVIELGEQDPPHPAAPEILSQLATVAEQEGSVDRALRMHQLLAEKFPDHERSKFAPGNVRRLSAVGQKIDDIKGPSLDGTPTALADFNGKVVLVDFWATWSAPCAIEMPELKRIRAELGGKGFEILGINVDENPGKAKLFLKEEGYAWPQISDTLDKETKATDETSLQLRYGASAIPLKLLVDRDGTLLATAHSLRQLRPTLEKLFPELPASAPPAEDKAPE